MEPKITVKKDYILVEPPKGVDYWQIYEEVGKLLARDDFPQKNDIWVFHEGPLLFLYEHLYKLKDFVADHYPKDFKGHKTAIVVETGIQTGLAEEYTRIVENLPFEIKVFSDIRSAEDWIKR